MASIVTLGVSFLVFFIVLGFMWVIGANILASVFAAAPVVQNAGWADTVEELENRMKIIFTWSIAILALFASIKMLMNATSRGAD